MQNSYLEVFDNLFFDVEAYDSINDIIEQATGVLDSIITRFGEVINEMTTGISRKDEFVDTVIILFIRKIMEQLDAINVLYSVSSFEAAQIILRSLIENIMGLEFILKDHTEERAAAYYLEHHYQELDRSKDFFNEEAKYAKIAIEQIGKVEFDRNCEKIKKKKKALEQVIKSKIIFQKTDIDRKRKLAKKRKQNKNRGKVYIQWYEVCSDITGIYGLMKAVGYEKYYDSIYGGLSFETHGLNATTGMNADNKGLLLKWIRSPEGGRSTFELTCNFSIRALQRVYQYLGDGKKEIDEFRDFFSTFVKERDIVGYKLDMIRSAFNDATE